MSIIPVRTSCWTNFINVPDWFSEATSQTPEHHTLNVLGKNIHCQTWGRAEAPGLLFVHGHAAHAHWWDFIAPAFAQQYYVGAMDMSGNGDSEHREKYTAKQFAEEIAQAAKWLGDNTIVVAHSFGGSMARIAAHYYPESMSSLILVDSVISPTRRETNVPDPVSPPRERFYQSIEIAARRFRLRPPQPRPEPYIHDYVARHSVKDSDQGFHFKLDPQVFDKMWPEENSLPDGATMIRELKVPCAYIYGELSRFCPSEVMPLLRELFPEYKLVGIQDAHHHVFLDQPRAFIAKLDDLLKDLSS